MKEAVVTLDSEAADTAQHLAEAWGVSLPEAVSRALKTAAAAANAPSREARIQAFLQLSHSLNLDDAKAQAWMDAIRDARR